MNNFCFDDVLLDPQFSRVRSRKEVVLSSTFLGLNLKLPVISANMDTITSVDMAVAMYRNGGLGALHRFSSIAENVKQFKSIVKKDANAIVSVGVGEDEFERAKALFKAGATHFLIDVNHGASKQVAEQLDAIDKLVGEKGYIIVGNFGNAKSVEDFITHAKCQPDAIKVGIGGGSMCTTRIVTGVGRPTLASVIDCVQVGIPVIADGGIRNSGDIAKCLAVGAKAVMLGSMLAGTEETPGETTDHLPYEQINGTTTKVSKFKKYRGSASRSSYETQGKVAQHRAVEGEETLVPCKGSVSIVLQQIEGGLRGALSMCNSFDLKEFSERAKLIEVTSNSVIESKPHGKK